MRFARQLAVPPGSRFKLSSVDPDFTGGFRDKADAHERLRENVKRLAELQYKLYADNRHALLVILQGLDASGKDSTIRHVFSGLNPQGCHVVSFKEPTADELDHDFLWRIHAHVPARGDIGVFNRSHYEDVLIVRVHELVPEKVWSARFEQINAFEDILAGNGVKILKIYLHISRDEQKARFEKRLKDPRRNWKFSPSDVEERRFWNDYVAAYEDVFRRCNSERAPWYVVPANHKWFRDAAVSEILLDALEGLDLRFPKPSFDAAKIRVP